MFSNVSLVGNLKMLSYYTYIVLYLLRIKYTSRIVKNKIDILFNLINCILTEMILKCLVKNWISWWSWLEKCQVSLGLVWLEEVSADVQSHWLEQSNYILFFIAQNYMYILSVYNYCYYYYDYFVIFRWTGMPLTPLLLSLIRNIKETLSSIRSCRHAERKLLDYNPCSY